MATIPTLLYYLSIFLMIEADSRRLGTRPVDRPTLPRLGELTRRYGYHFTSLRRDRGAAWSSGMSAFRAVFWATVLAVALELRPAAKRR